MSGITFFVGERPSEPLVITVTKADGTVRNLSGYTDVEVEAIDGALPAGITDVVNAAEGRLQYDFTDAFETTDVVNARVVMTTADGDVDYSDRFTLTVADPEDSDELITTTAAAEMITNVPVSTADLTRAQYQITLVTGRNLGDDDWFASLGTNDQFWLKMAVAWQAADAKSATFSLPYVPGATSISNGDVSVSYGSGEASFEVGIVSRNAAIALKRLSWMRNMRSVQAKPFTYERCQPNPWVPMYRTSM